MENAHAPAAEHRLLSIMFCDMVDSTGQQFRMAPEQFAAVLTAYRETVFDCVRRRGGYVARVVGDGVLIFFGWPSASGKDAQTAVSCALDIAARIERGLDGVKVAARLAVETGWVLVGDLGTANAPRIELEHATVVGMAPNVAARLQQYARRNGVIAGPGTLPLLNGGFVTEPADTTGVNLPFVVQAAHVIREAGSGDPLGRLRQPLDGSPVVPVGREDIFQDIRARWGRARDGEGQAVLLTGNAGMGKSHLLAALLHDVGPFQPEIMGLFCSPASRDSPFHPLEPWLRDMTGIQPDAVQAEVQQRSADFAASLGLNDPAAGMAVATLLGAIHADAPGPGAMRRHIFDVLLAAIGKLSREHPLLIMVEDLHWADPSTREFLSQVAAFIPGRRVMLIVTDRDTHEAAFPQDQSIVRLSLGPLGTEAAEALADRTARALGLDLDTGTRTAIIGRSDGVALFVQEFVRALANPRAPMAHPPGTIGQLLTARLDALGFAKPLAQVASVVGPEASLDLLFELAQLPRPRFEDAIERLTSGDVLVRRGVEDKAVVAFRHALLADAAYHGMPSARRRELHRLVARALQRVSPALAATAPENLAHHLAEAGEKAEAAVLFRSAAHFRLASGAYAEAEAHARRDVELSEALSAGTGKKNLLAGLMPLGEALIATRGYAHLDVQAVYERAARLAMDLGTAAELLPALRGLTSFYQVRGPMSRARELGAQVLRIARVVGDDALIRQAERRHGWCLLCEGRLTEAEALLESSLARHARLDPAERDAQRDDALVLSHLAWSDWFTKGAAATMARAELAAARADMGSPLHATYALGFVAVAHQICGDREGAARYASQSGAIARERGIVYWIAMADAVIGWSDAIRGDASGLGVLRTAIADYDRTQGRVLRPYLLGLLAEAELGLGSRDRALAAISEADAIVNAIGVELYRAPLLRLRALAQTGSARAVTLLAAKNTAIAQGARAFAALIAEDIDA